MMNQVAAVLRCKRVELQLSARDLSAYSNLPLVDIVELEWGMRDDIDCITLSKITYCLGMELFELFALVEAAERGEVALALPAAN